MTTYSRSKQNKGSWKNRLPTKNYMSLKNYTTKIPANRSVNEIQEMLQKAGATGSLLEYEKETGRISSLSFKIEINGNNVGFKLPLKWKNVQAVLANEKNNRAKDDNYVYRVAWRILRNWVDVQMALIKIEQVDLQQVFLPYTIQKNGKTLYENVLDNPQLLIA